MDNSKTSTPRFPSAEDLIANATDFLKSATADLKARPKHSVIAFYSAIELILKARLLAEHWTLVVSKNADRTSFAKGDFVSVGFDEACARLQNVVGSPLPENAKAIFNSLRKHRNKMVHFYHEGQTDDDALEAIALEQLLAWQALVTLMESQWQRIFADMVFDITAIDAGFSEHRLYAKAKFENLGDKLKNILETGGTLIVCRSCGFKSAERNQVTDSIYSSRCLVCSGFRRQWMVASCPACGKELINEGDDGATCEHCDTRFSVQELVDDLNEEAITKDNYFEAVTPANCSNCDGYHTVISWDGGYVCVACIEYTDDVECCGWCSEYNNGDMESSSLHGCSHCDGNAKLLYDD